MWKNEDLVGGAASTVPSENVLLFKSENRMKTVNRMKTGQNRNLDGN